MVLRDLKPGQPFRDGIDDACILKNFTSLGNACGWYYNYEDDAWCAYEGWRMDEPVMIHDPYLNLPEEAQLLMEKFQAGEE